MAAKEHSHNTDKTDGRQRPQQPTPSAVEALEYASSSCLQYAKRDPYSLAPHNVLQIQQTMGNQVVQRLLVQGNKIQAHEGPIRRMMPAVAVAPPVVVAPAPTLTAANAGGDLEGYCGYFQRVKRWQVANPVQGIIVQHVRRIFNVERINPKGRLAGAALDAYVTDPNSTVNATETEYWELWTVDAMGNVSDGGDDTFGLCSLIPGPGLHKNSTKGTFTMIGVATFYPTNNHPATFGFAQNAVVSAGGLFSTLADPSATLPAAAGPTVTHNVVVAWDSTFTAQKPKKKKQKGIQKKTKSRGKYVLLTSVVNSTIT